MASLRERIRNATIAKSNLEITAADVKALDDLIRICVATITTKPLSESAKNLIAGISHHVARIVRDIPG